MRMRMGTAAVLDENCYARLGLRIEDENND